MSWGTKSKPDELAKAAEMMHQAAEGDRTAAGRASVAEKVPDMSTGRSQFGPTPQASDLAQLWVRSVQARVTDLANIAARTDELGDNLADAARMYQQGEDENRNTIQRAGELPR
jgi:hypothetical protein